MKSTRKCILGKNTSELLNLLRVGPPTKQEVLQTTASTKLNPSKQQLINKYQDIFKGMGFLKNFKLQLHINQNIQHQFNSPYADCLTTPNKSYRMNSNDCKTLTS